MDQITPASDLAKIAPEKHSPGLLGRRGGPQSLIQGRCAASFTSSRTISS